MIRYSIQLQGIVSHDITAMVQYATAWDIINLIKNINMAECSKALHEMVLFCKKQYRAALHGMVLLFCKKQYRAAFHDTVRTNTYGMQWQSMGGYARPLNGIALVYQMEK
jgi:hypothetical protein